MPVAREVWRRSRMRRAGLPATTAQAGTSLVTTEPAPITAWEPTVTPSTITTFEPIQTSSPMVMPRSVSGCRWTGRSGSIAWLKPRIEVCAPTRTPSPMVTAPRTTAKAFTLQSWPAWKAPVTYACAAM